MKDNYSNISNQPKKVGASNLWVGIVKKRTDLKIIVQQQQYQQQQIQELSYQSQEQNQEIQEQIDQQKQQIDHLEQKVQQLQQQLTSNPQATRIRRRRCCDSIFGLSCVGKVEEEAEEVYKLTSVNTTEVSTQTTSLNPVEVEIREADTSGIIETTEVLIKD